MMVWVSFDQAVVDKEYTHQLYAHKWVYSSIVCVYIQLLAFARV